MSILKELIELFNKYNVTEYTIDSKSDGVSCKFFAPVKQTVVEETKVEKTGHHTLDTFMALQSELGFDKSTSTRIDNTRDPKVDYVTTVRKDIEKKIQKTEAENKPTGLKALDALNKPEKISAEVSTKKVYMNGRELIDDLGLEKVEAEIKELGNFAEFCRKYGVSVSNLKYHLREVKGLPRYGTAYRENKAKEEAAAKEKKSETKKEEKKPDVKVVEVKTKPVTPTIEHVAPKLPAVAARQKKTNEQISFSKQEEDIIKEYITNKRTCKDCADILKISTSQFHNMVTRFRRTVGK